MSDFTPSNRDSATVSRTDWPGLLAHGKVRDLYDLGDRLLMVATDRISAFDVVMTEPVPGKGRILTQMSRFWLETLPACRPHHLDYVVTAQRCPAQFAAHADALDGRAAVVRKAIVVPLEFVVRGYIVGGGWKEYCESGCVSGIRLPAGLRIADRLPQPIFTPSTKAASGHDEPIAFETACARLTEPSSELLRALRSAGWHGQPAALRELLETARSRALEIYEQAAAYAAPRGVLIADTKFEFGIVVERDTPKMLLIDEVLTPDSSRFWPAEAWRPGAQPPSFDKQFLRDYLESLNWPKQPPPPPIPPAIIEQTRNRYVDAMRLLLEPGKAAPSARSPIRCS